MDNHGAETDMKRMLQNRNFMPSFSVVTTFEKSPLAPSTPILTKVPLQAPFAFQVSIRVVWERTPRVSPNSYQPLVVHVSAPQLTLSENRYVQMPFEITSSIPPVASFKLRRAAVS